MLSAYAAQSHRQWAATLMQMFASWRWQVLELPARHFSWRIRGNPLYWALEERAILEQDYDLIVATSMVDLSTLRGLVPALAQTPTALYFHENQFVYPQRALQSSLLDAQMVTLYAGLAADRLLFNSRYNRDTYIDGVASLLQRLPDFVPADVAPSLLDKSAVLPVPVQMAAAPAARQKPSAPSSPRALRLLWVGRFEHDKGADRLLRVLRLLRACANAGQLDFELAVIGQQFRNSPPEFAQIQAEFAERLVAFGYIESRGEYERQLADADIVLSTATHEFQGLAVLEAVAAGCVPVVPDRLAYVELFPAANRYASHAADVDSEAAAAAQLVASMAEQFAAGTPPRGIELAEYSPAVLKAGYDRVFESLLHTGRAHE